MELKLTTNEFIQINQSEKLVKWKVSVGRKNFKNTEFNFFNNKEQRKVRFIKAGQYQLTLTSQALGNSPNIEQHVLDIIVED